MPDLIILSPHCGLHSYLLGRRTGLRQHKDWGQLRKQSAQLQGWIGLVIKTFDSGNKWQHSKTMFETRKEAATDPSKSAACTLKENTLNFVRFSNGARCVATHTTYNLVRQTLAKSYSKWLLNSYIITKFATIVAPTVPNQFSTHS